MFREPQESEKVEKVAKLEKIQKSTNQRRFQIEKLEERIAPVGNCHLTPHGQWVSCRHVPIL